MKKLLVVLMALAMVVSMLAALPLAVSADGEEAEASVWSGKANIKWYVDALAENPQAEEFHIQTAEDLAGLAYLVHAYYDASNFKGAYNGLWYDTATGDVLGFAISGYETGFAFNYTERGYYIPAPAEKFNAATGQYLPEYDEEFENTIDGSANIPGTRFDYKTIILDADLVLNEGNAADWATNPPANAWIPIGGARHEDAKFPAFNGTFKAQGHSISGMYVSNSDEMLYGFGLFGSAAAGRTVTIQDLVIENSYCVGDECVGAFVGRTNNMVNMVNCHIRNVSVKALSSSAAAFVGFVNGGTLVVDKSSATDVTVEGLKAVGGVVGLDNFQGVYVTDTILHGTVRGFTVPVVDEEGNDAGTKGGWDVGGIVGRATQGGINVSNVIADLALIQEADDYENENTSYTASVGSVYGAIAKKSAAGDLWGAPTLSVENYFFVNNIQAGGHVLEFASATAVNESQLLGNAPKVNLPSGIFDFETVWAYGSTNTADSISARLPQLRLAGKSSDEEPGQPEDPEDQHVFGTLIKGTKATCEEPGVKDHYHCTHCDKDFDEDFIEITDGLTIPAKGHKYGSLIPEKAATADEDGMKAHYECSACGKYFDENKAEVTAASLVIPKTGNGGSGDGEKKGCFGVVAGVPFVAVVVFGAAMLVRKKENEGK